MSNIKSSYWWTKFQNQFKSTVNDEELLIESWTEGPKIYGNYFPATKQDYDLALINIKNISMQLTSIARAHPFKD